MLKLKHQTGLKILEIGLTGILIMLLGVAFMQVAGTADLQSTFLVAQEEASVQYALIMDAEVTTASNAVFEGLKAAAKVDNAVITPYLVNSDQTLKEAFELAALTDCKGIFVKLRKNPGASEQIQEAVQRGQRVVVIDHDAPDSLRDAYVGANPLLVGKKAAAMAYKWSKAFNPQSVLILLGASHQDATGIASSAYLNGFRQSLEQQAHLLDIEVAYTSERPVEVIVEDALKRGSTQVFVCTEPEDTIKAMNVLIDYNRIKDVVLIGSGNSSEVIAGVEKGLIEASIQIDYSAMGEEALLLMTRLTKEDAPTAYKLMPIDVIEGP